MTTGNWIVGTPYFSPTLPGLFHGSKTWSGGDGLQWPDGEIHRGPPWHDYTMTYQRWLKLQGHLKIKFYRPATQTTQESAYVWPVPGEPSLNRWDTFMELQLLSKLSKVVRAHDYHVGVSLAEVDKTAALVTQSIGKITRGVWELSRGNVSGAFRAWGSTARKRTPKTSLKVKDVSGQFLEMSYGWMPLVNDVFSAAKAFEEISQGPRGITFRASKKYPMRISANPQGVIRHYHTDIVRRTYLYEQREELNALRSMGLLDPASVLWERLPWSFVIDWFMPIGTYLNLIGVVPHLKGRFLRTTSATRTFTAGDWIPESTFAQVMFVPPFEGRYFRMHRTVLSSLSVPYPRVRVAGAVQGRRVGNAIALAHQMFDRALGFKPRTRLRHMSRFDKSDFSWPYYSNFDR